MKPSEQIEHFFEFLNTNYKDELLEQINKGEKFLLIDFGKLSEQDIELAEELLEHPEDVLKAGEIAVDRFELPVKPKRFRIRVFNLPDMQKIAIRDIRSKDIGKFIVVEGLIRQKSDVRPRVVSAKFECPSCGNVITVLQLEKKFKEPSMCTCGRKGKFKLLDKELVDAQGMVLEESPETLEGGEQPKRLNLFLKEDLVSPITDRKTNPGTKVRAIGWVKEVEKILRSGGKSTGFDLVMEVNYLETIEETFYDIKITKEEEEKILELAKRKDIYDLFIRALAPTVYGYEAVKEALVYQMVGGTRKEFTGGAVTRGDIHVLLVGDPGAGKSQLLKRISYIAPKGRYVSGKGVSGAGLTATVVKDEFLGGWSLEAGALVLANNGICCIDELDKMTKEDRSAMHEALEQQTISISKANIQATLLSRTTVLAAANPKMGRFDPKEVIARQIDLPPALINRFDLIFPIRDLPDEHKDEMLATHILKLHQKQKVEETVIDEDLFKKYMAYAKQRIKPKLTDEALDEIKSYYLKMRSKGKGEEGSAIPISPRQLEAIIRLSEAAAKIRLSNRVTRKDAKRAIALLETCLSAVGIDPETGELDIDRITSGITATQRSKIGRVKDVINELEKKFGTLIPIEEVTNMAQTQGLTLTEVEEIVQKLIRAGDIFEPRRGFIRKM